MNLRKKRFTKCALELIKKSSPSFINYFFSKLVLQVLVKWYLLIVTHDLKKEKNEKSSFINYSTESRNHSRHRKTLAKDVFLERKGGYHQTLQTLQIFFQILFLCLFCLTSILKINKIIISCDKDVCEITWSILNPCIFYDIKEKLIWFGDEYQNFLIFIALLIARDEVDWKH